MNIQSMMKQVQKIQKEMQEEKIKIDSKVFESESSLVKVTMKGTKELLNVKINAEEIETDEIEMLEDMIVVAINDVIRKIDEETEQNLGKYTKGMPGF